MTMINSAIFGECEVIETVKGKAPKAKKTKEVIIAKPLNDRWNGRLWVTWSMGEGYGYVTGNLCSDSTIEFARLRANEYIAVGHGLEVK